MLILLDIDGVMVPASNWKRPQFGDDGFPQFSKQATEGLQNIISETGAEILLTTSHKSNYTIREWKIIFSNRGIKNISIKKLSKNTRLLNRKDEVLNWVLKTQRDDFIIIDDDKSLNELPSRFKSKLVQPSATVGLNRVLANDAIRILKS